MAFTGLSLIDNTVPRAIPHREHVFKWLDSRNISWRVYHDGPPFFLLLGDFEDLLRPNFRPISQLGMDIQSEPPGARPQVIFIEPRYYDYFWSDRPANCNHPLARLCNGELLLHDVYSQLTSNPDRWAKTMFIVTYDEHGGFFDHVPPLPIQSPVPAGAQYTTGFSTTGPRVPAIVASPWVQQGQVFNKPLDHTSFLQVIAEKFGGSPEAYSPSVSQRRQQGILSVSQVLDSGAARAAVSPPAPRACPPSMRAPPSVRPPKTDNEKAFQRAAEEFKQSKGAAAVEKYPELATVPPEGGG
jgi:phospholipase C